MNTPIHYSSNTNSPIPPVRILVADDEPEIRDYLQLALCGPNVVIDFAENGEEVVNLLEQDVHKPSLVILDVMMPRKNGLTTLREIRGQDLHLPVIMLSGLSSLATREEAISHGANDFLTKPVSHQELREAVDLLLHSTPAPSTADNSLLAKRELVPRLGNWMRTMEPLLKRVATCDVPILLQGETGAGKEVLARQIHEQSQRCGKAFLKLNCAALPPELVESELFGYERGAFTGAFKSTAGKFELADGGTILLDEIGDMDVKLQAKLLQVLQDREFHRLGARVATQVDVRVIAATHRKLEERIEEGQFREDLYYRLNVVNIVIPPLRERADEIMPLAQFFLRKHLSPGDLSVPEIGRELRAALFRHRWPGNVRELENVMRRYLVVRNAQLIADDLNRANEREGVNSARATSRWSSAQPSIAHVSLPETPSRPAADQARQAPQSILTALPGSDDGQDSELARLGQARKDAEIELIRKVLHSTQWNRKRAAKLLGIDYKALLYKMKKLGID